MRDIALPDELQAALKARNPVVTKQRIGNLAWSRKNRQARSEAQEHGRVLARAGNALHQAGCMLYWAEGAKKRNGVASRTATWT